MTNNGFREYSRAVKMYRDEDFQGAITATAAAIAKCDSSDREDLSNLHNLLAFLVGETLMRANSRPPDSLTCEFSEIVTGWQHFLSWTGRPPSPRHSHGAGPSPFSFLELMAYQEARCKQDEDDSLWRIVAQQLDLSIRYLRTNSYAWSNIGAVALGATDLSLSVACFIRSLVIAPSTKGLWGRPVNSTVLGMLEYAAASRPLLSAHIPSGKIATSGTLLHMEDKAPLLLYCMPEMILCNDERTHGKHNAKARRKLADVGDCFALLRNRYRQIETMPDRADCLHTDVMKMEELSPPKTDVQGADLLRRHLAQFAGDFQVTAPFWHALVSESELLGGTERPLADL